MRREGRLPGAHPRIFHRLICRWPAAAGDRLGSSLTAHRSGAAPARGVQHLAAHLHEVAAEVVRAAVVHAGDDAAQRGRRQQHRDDGVARRGQRQRLALVAPRHVAVGELRQPLVGQLVDARRAVAEARRHGRQAELARGRGRRRRRRRGRGGRARARASAGPSRQRSAVWFPCTGSSLPPLAMLPPSAGKGQLIRREESVPVSWSRLDAAPCAGDGPCGHLAGFAGDCPAGSFATCSDVELTRF